MNYNRLRTILPRYLYSTSSSRVAYVRGLSQKLRVPYQSKSSTVLIHRRHSSIDTSFLNDLSSTLPHLQLNTNTYDLESHGKGESYHPSAPPAAIITPTSNEDIVQIIKLCNKYHIPLIPFGTGTSVEGHVSAIYSNSISLDMKEFKFIDDSDYLKDPCIKVGAGVTRLELNERLRHSGMQFMVDPGADASIGGMVACGASGTTAVKYGTMRQNILSLECILPNGSIAQCGTQTLKSSAGYDLVSLMTGSEGTLGVITHITVKLHPIPENITAAICTFDNIHDAAEAVAMMKMSSISMERCEILDESSIMAFLNFSSKHNNNYQHKLQIKPTLFLEFAGPSLLAVQEQVNMTKSICSDLNGSNFQFTTDDNERKSLWEARHKLYYASIASRKGATKAIVTDACVPLSSFANVITDTVEDVKKYNVIGPIFGHAGDGNFHCILPMRDDDDDEYIEKLHEVNHNLIERTLKLSGSCTGEHGIGYGKMKYLKEQFGDGGVEMMRMVKRGLDPNNIMNPGKIVSL